MTKRGLPLISILFVRLMCVSPAAAQDPTGGIEGLVTDSSAAVVPSARATARNVDNGLVREVRAGADGFYRIRALPVGQYVLTVDAQRFAPFTQQAIQVNVNEAVRVDVQLGLAAVTEW